MTTPMTTPTTTPLATPMTTTTHHLKRKGGSFRARPEAEPWKRKAVTTHPLPPTTTTTRRLKRKGGSFRARPEAEPWMQQVSIPQSHTHHLQRKASRPQQQQQQQQCHLKLKAKGAVTKCCASQAVVSRHRKRRMANHPMTLKALKRLTR